MMYSEGKKLHLIEEILRIENESVLNEVEAIIRRNRLREDNAKSVDDFAGIWTKKEADEIKRIIEDNCEQINPDDWK